jgi:hypothetical protein
MSGGTEVESIPHVPPAMGDGVCPRDDRLDLEHTFDDRDVSRGRCEFGDDGTADVGFERDVADGAASELDTEVRRSGRRRSRNRPGPAASGAGRRQGDGRRQKDHRRAKFHEGIIGRRRVVS